MHLHLLNIDECALSFFKLIFRLVVLKRPESVSVPVSSDRPSAELIYGGSANLDVCCWERSVFLCMARLFLLTSPLPPRTEGSLWLFVVEDGRKLALGQDQQSAGAYWKRSEGPAAAASSVFHSHRKRLLRRSLSFHQAGASWHPELGFPAAVKEALWTGGKVSWNQFFNTFHFIHKRVVHQTCSWAVPNVQTTRLNFPSLSVSCWSDNLSWIWTESFFYRMIVFKCYRLTKVGEENWPLKCIY